MSDADIQRKLEKELEDQLERTPINPLIGMRGMFSACEYIQTNLIYF